jgi:cytoskeleton protein RodZ
LAGEILRKRREDLGQDIHEISDLLKIKADYLSAIENDTFAKLPAPVYTMGYIRCYAKYLEVDAESIIHHYAGNLSQPEHTTIIPLAYSQKKSPKIYYVALLLVFAAAAFFIYLSQVPTVRKNAAKVPPEIPGLVAASPSGVSSAKEAKVDIAAGSEHRLGIAASDTTWISVKFEDGKTEEMLLRPGNSRSLVFSDKVLLKIGNAGGISVSLDGKSLGVPGLPGQVITLSLPVR